MSGLTRAELRDLAPSFVLDLLDPKLAAEIRGRLAEDLDLYQEFAELGAAVPALALLTEPVTPPAALKARLLAVTTSSATAGATAQVRAGEQTLNLVP